MAGEAEDRTEAATPKRLARAREEGQAPLSREVAVAASLAASAGVLMMVAPRAMRDAGSSLAGFLSPEFLATQADPLVALGLAARLWAKLALPFALAAIAAAVIAVLGQTGGLVNLGALQPKLSRLRPTLSRLGGPHALLETGKALLKLAVAAAVAWSILGGLPRTLLEQAAFWQPGSLLARVQVLVVRLALTLAGAQAVLAVLDVLRARIMQARGLRMSRHELREEHRESEGDPVVKHRLRRLRMSRAKRRMMAAVPRATVVVTNPTHYAVALVYDRANGGAPRVVAKGMDELAARIREVAREARVPLIANPPLARALWRVELDSEIPSALFQAVAEIIASVWRLRAPAGAGRP